MPMPPNEVPQLDMYDFLIEPIRELDQKEGNQFVQRFLMEPQRVWEDTQAKIFQIKDLWSITECPDEFLTFLKNIVGWTKDLDPITRDLTLATLRRLISTSIPLWKTRGPEDAIVSVLNLLTGQRTRIWNYFDFQWVLGETELTWDNRGFDPWIINLPGPPDLDEYRFNVRIVDPDYSTLDRTLIKNVLNLMRAAGERIEVTYLAFLDLFDIDDDDSQWDQTVGSTMNVASGELTLTDDTAEERAIVSVAGASAWSEYVVAARVKGDLTTGTGKIGVLFNYQDANNHFVAWLDFDQNALLLDVVVAGTPTNLATVDLSTFSLLLYENLYYMLRVEVVAEGSDQRVKVFIDGSMFISLTRASAPDTGPAGLIHESGVQMTADEVEVLFVPVETDTVDINFS